MQSARYAWIAAVTAAIPVRLTLELYKVERDCNADLRGDRLGMDQLVGTNTPPGRTLWKRATTRKLTSVIKSPKAEKDSMRIRPKRSDSCGHALGRIFGEGTGVTHRTPPCCGQAGQNAKSGGHSHVHLRDSSLDNWVSSA